MVGLNPADRKRPIRTYSKGMMQRVGLAQALINDPELLFLDEPTTGLDPIGARAMKDAILQVRDKGKTVLLCSHLLADVQAVCDRVAIVSEGKLVKFGTVNELVGRSQRFEVFASGLSETALNEARQKNIEVQQDADGVRLGASSSEELDTVLNFVRDHGGRTVDVKGHSETLEDVFVRSVRSDGR
jgi:ABC-2 type transport system ATP-binding protein